MMNQFKIIIINIKLTLQFWATSTLNFIILNFKKSMVMIFSIMTTKPLIMFLLHVIMALIIRLIFTGMIYAQENYDPNINNRSWIDYFYDFCHMLKRVWYKTKYNVNIDEPVMTNLYPEAILHPQRAELINTFKNIELMDLYINSKKLTYLNERLLLEYINQNISWKAWSSNSAEYYIEDSRIRQRLNRMEVGITDPRELETFIHFKTAVLATDFVCSLSADRNINYFTFRSCYEFLLTPNLKPLTMLPSDSPKLIPMGVGIPSQSDQPESHLILDDLELYNPIESTLSPLQELYYKLQNESDNEKYHLCLRYLKTNVVPILDPLMCNSASTVYGDFINLNDLNQLYQISADTKEFDTLCHLRAAVFAKNYTIFYNYDPDLATSKFVEYMNQIKMRNLLEV